MEYKWWVKEKDPMRQESSLLEGWVEGPIKLVNVNDNRRHYVRNVAIYAGSGIQVKFGNGWIDGLYVWHFDGKGPIVIHRGEDVITITEGHIV